MALCTHSQILNSYSQKIIPENSYFMSTTEIKVSETASGSYKCNSHGDPTKLDEFYKNE